VLLELRNWWSDIPPETKTALQDGGLILAALLGGHILGVIVARALRARNLDGALRLPGSSPQSPDAEHGFTPTWVAGMLVRLTVWAWAAWWLAHKHGRADIAGTLGLVIRRTWAVATLLVAALALGSLLSRRLIDCLQGLTKSSDPSRNGTGASHRGV